MSILESVEAVRQLLAKRELQPAVDKLNQLQTQARNPSLIAQFGTPDVIGHLVDTLEDFKQVPPLQLPVIIIFMALSLNQNLSAEVGKNGGLKPLVDAITTTKEPLIKQHGSGALRNLCTNEVNRNIICTIPDAPQKLVDYVRTNLKDANDVPVGSTIMDNVISVMGLMAKTEETSIEFGQKCGAVTLIRDLFELPLNKDVHKTVLLSTLRFVQFLAHWSDENGEELAKAGIVKHINSFTKINDDNIVKLSNNILQMIPESGSEEGGDSEQPTESLNSQLDTIVDNLASRDRRAASLGLLHSLIENKPNNVKAVLDHEVDIVGTLIDLLALGLPSVAPQGNTQVLENLSICLLELAKNPQAMTIINENRDQVVANLIQKTLQFAMSDDMTSVKSIHLLVAGLALLGFLTFNKEIARTMLSQQIFDLYNDIYAALLTKASDRDYSHALSFIIKAYINLGREDSIIMAMKDLGIIDMLVEVVMNVTGQYSTPVTLRQDACTALWNMSNCEEARAYIHSLDCYAIMAEMLPAIELASTNASTAQKDLGMSEEALAQALLRRRKREDVEQLRKMLAEREEEVGEQEDDDLEELEAELEEEELQPEEIDPEEELEPSELVDELEEPSTAPKAKPQTHEDGDEELVAEEVMPSEFDEAQEITEDLNEDEIEELKRKKRMMEEREEIKRKEKEEKIQKRREQRRKERQAVKDQETAESDKKNKKAAKRRMICMELLNTEEAYVKALSKVEELYMRPLATTHSNLLPADKFKTIFGDIKIIHKINEDFLREMDNLFKKEDFWGKEEQYLGSFFLKRMTTFKLYTNFVNGYTASEACLQEVIRKNRKFGDFLNKVMDKLIEERSRQTDLPSFLVQPIQRLPRYSLLLTDLLRNTDFNETHSAYLLLESALLEVQSITKFVNEGKRNNEQVLQARDLIKKLGIQKQIGENKRALIRSEKDFTYVTYDKYRPNATRTKAAKCKVHIFEDHIVVVRDGIVSKTIIMHLYDCKVKYKVLDKDKEGHCFTIEDEKPNKTKDPDADQVVEIDCGDQSLRNDVFSTLRNLIADLRLKKTKIIQMK
jgi:hypothetical protein